MNHKEIIEQIARERKREFDRVAKRGLYRLSENAIATFNIYCKLLRL